MPLRLLKSGLKIGITAALDAIMVHYAEEIKFISLKFEPVQILVGVNNLIISYLPQR